MSVLGHHLGASVLAGRTRSAWHLTLAHGVPDEVAGMLDAGQIQRVHARLHGEGRVRYTHYVPVEDRRRPCDPLQAHLRNAAASAEGLYEHLDSDHGVTAPGTSCEALHRAHAAAHGMPA
jgi:hypothetical protein